MTRDEFDNLGEYAMQLWPAWEPTDAQRESWYHAMRFTALDAARQALHNAYTRTKWKEPALPDVLAAIKELKRETLGTTDTDFSQEHIDRCNREEGEDHAALAGWTDEDYENGKKEIIAHEPGMKTFAGMPARSRLWSHFLVERYVYQRATVFSPGIITRNGKAVRVPCANPQQVSRDEYWSAKA